MSEIVKQFINSMDSKPTIKPKSIGLFFGSFNPIHVGHLIIANHIVNHTDLDELWFVVSPHNPHKLKSSLLEDYHRLAIVKEAIDDNPKFKASDIEFDLPKPSYTVDTLAYLKEKHPSYQFALIMGGDNLRSFHKWKNYEVILEQYPIYVYPRILTIQEIEAKSKEVDNGLMDHENVYFVDAPIMKISSSMIRDFIKRKRDTKYLLTESVRKYVEEMNFYKK